MILFVYTLDISAQVTIGSKEEPEKGTLLDIKANIDGSSEKGLLLPRVFLDDRKSDIGQSMGLDTPNLYKHNSHIGITVSNINRCSFFGKGVYIWDVITWQKVGDKLLAELHFNQDLF